MSELASAIAGYVAGGAVTFVAISIIILWMMFC
jgi:hypothetical protein